MKTLRYAALSTTLLLLTGCVTTAVTEQELTSSGLINVIDTQYGGDVNVYNRKNTDHLLVNDPALYFASENRTDLIQTMLDKGLDLNDPEADHPLYLFYFDGIVRKSTMIWLLEKGATMQAFEDKVIADEICGPLATTINNNDRVWTRFVVLNGATSMACFDDEHSVSPDSPDEVKLLYAAKRAIYFESFDALRGIAEAGYKDLVTQAGKEMGVSTSAITAGINPADFTDEIAVVSLQEKAAVAHQPEPEPQPEPVEKVLTEEEIAAIELKKALETERKAREAKFKIAADIYRRFWDREVVPLTIRGQFLNRACGSPHHNPRSNPSKYYYEAANWSADFAECATKKLNKFDITRFENKLSYLAEKEQLLWEATDKKNRWLPAKEFDYQRKQYDKVVEDIKHAWRNYNELMDEGDYLAQQEAREKARDEAYRRSLNQAMFNIANSFNIQAQQQQQQFNQTLRSYTQQAYQRQQQQINNSRNFQTSSQILPAPKPVQPAVSQPQPKLQAREIVTPAKSVQQQVARTTAKHCVSHGLPFDRSENVCFSNGMNEYGCRIDSQGPYWTHVQKLSLKSSLEDKRLCKVVIDNDTQPSGSPIR